MFFPSTFICGNACCLTIDINGNVYAFGDNEYNKLCIFPFCDPIKTPTQIDCLNNIKSISCGIGHTLWLDYNGNVFSFGKNSDYQLGVDSNNSDIKSPFKVDLPPINLIESGDNFNMCVSTDGQIYAFGLNNYGQLGLGNTNDYKTIQVIPNISDISHIICGDNYSICKNENDICFSWGNNGKGQLGNGSLKHSYKPLKCNNWPDNIIDIKCGNLHTLLLTSEGQVYSFGSNDSGQLGLNKNSESIKIPTLIKDMSEIQRIECGSKHSMCIDYNNSLWVFGHNSYGQLGINSIDNIYKPIKNQYISDIIDISTGSYNIFIKTCNGKIYGSGANYYYQMGKDISKKQLQIPTQILKEKEDIWNTITRNSRAKSARK